MFPRSHLPPMLGYYHRPGDCAALPGLRISMVRPTYQNDQRSRPQIHLVLRKSPLRETRYRTKPIYSVPSPNRRTIRTKEPMDRTIPSISHLKRPKGMDTLARARYDCAQQPNQHYYGTLAQPNPLWVQPHAQLRQSVTNP